MTAIVLRGDARALPLPDGCVDLIVTSPPYFGLRSYTDDGAHYDGQIGSEATPAEWLAALVGCTAEWVRVLKPSGSIFVNLGDSYHSGKGAPGKTTTDPKNADRNARRTTRSPLDYGLDLPQKTLLGLPWRYALACMDQLGLILRRDIIWSKPNGLPESVVDRCRSSHEYLFHFTVLPRYYAAVDEIREPHLFPNQSRTKGRSMNGGVRQPEGFASMDPELNPLGKLPGSVWDIPSQPLTVPAALGVDHFASFPMELPRRCVLGWSPPGVCTACGEGRRPVVDKRLTNVWHDKPLQDSRYVSSDKQMHNTRATYGQPYGSTSATITGYACACNEVIDTPTGHVVAPDPTMAGGKAGFKRERSPESGTRPITRWEQRHYAAQIAASPYRAEMERDIGRPLDHYQKPSRSSGRPLPPGVLESWLERGWLSPAPEYVPAPTRPALVVDPFGGTGTTALVASMYGRTGLSFDLSADYCRLARWRTADPAERARALQVPKPPPVPDGQGSLFDDLETFRPKPAAPRRPERVPDCPRCAADWINALDAGQFPVRTDLGEALEQEDALRTATAIPHNHPLDDDIEAV